MCNQTRNGLPFAATVLLPHSGHRQRPAISVSDRADLPLPFRRHFKFHRRPGLVRQRQSPPQPILQRHHATFLRPRRIRAAREELELEHVLLIRRQTSRHDQRPIRRARD